MSHKEIRRIAVFSSGGDAPGMNAAIRAVVRTAVYHNMHVYGIREGYEGMIKGKISRLEKGDVANIIHMGGTFLKTARSQEFMTPEGRELAYQTLLAHDIDACVAIGGNGTYTGAKVFTETYDIPFIGIPGTIDNDIYGTDLTVGFDTAINTAVEAIDRIRDTADSHNRLFFIEVMGRHAGNIALNTGIGTGASFIFLPEKDQPIDKLREFLQKSARRKKLFNMVVVAEGNQNGNAIEIARILKEENNIDSKVTIIGHLQRGGSPSARDRVLASRFGFHAVKGLLNGTVNAAVGIMKNDIVFTPFEDAISKQKALDSDLLEMADILSL
jgi:6-phosphofructokinase 1